MARARGSRWGRSTEDEEEEREERRRAARERAQDQSRPAPAEGRGAPTANPESDVERGFDEQRQQAEELAARFRDGRASRGDAPGARDAPSPDQDVDADPQLSASDPGGGAVDGPMPDRGMDADPELSRDEMGGGARTAPRPDQGVESDPELSRDQIGGGAADAPPPDQGVDADPDVGLNGVRDDRRRDRRRSRRVGGGGDDPTRDGSRPTGPTGPGDTPGGSGGGGGVGDDRERDRRRSRRVGGGGGGGGGGGERADRGDGGRGGTAPSRTPDQTPDARQGLEEFGDEDLREQASDLERRALRETEGLDDPSEVRVVRQGDRLVAELTEEGRESLAEQIAADVAPAARAVARDPGRQPQPVAGSRQAARAVERDPGRGRPDPVAEVRQVSDALEELSATSRPAGPAEYGADVRGFDEVGSGPFDLPRGAGGGAQEEAQDVVDDVVGGPTDRVARTAEDVRRDVLAPLPDVGVGTSGGLAAAAAAGVVAPEPVSTGTGALILGGLAVGGVAVDVARRRGEFDVPESGEFFPEEEATPSAPVTETTVRLPEVDQSLAEVPLPERGERQRSEVPVPEEPVGTGTGEVPVPELGTSLLEQTIREEERERRRREREQGSPFGGGASDEELEDILRGPSDPTTLGEEPAEPTVDDGGREFVRERDTDPRVVVPEETADPLDTSRAFEPREAALPADVAGAGESPDTFLGAADDVAAGLVGDVGMVSTGAGTQQFTGARTSPALDQLLEGGQGFALDGALDQLLDEPTGPATGPGQGFLEEFVDEIVDPTSPGGGRAFGDPSDFRLDLDGERSRRTGDPTGEDLGRRLVEFDVAGFDELVGR